MGIEDGWICGWNPRTLTEEEQKKQQENLDKFTKEFFKKTKVYENDKWTYYEDTWTEQFTQHINQYDENGITFPDKLRVLKAESKTDSTQCYVAFDTKGRPVLDFDDSFDFDIRVLAYKMQLADSYNIVNMAKKKKKKKKGGKKR